jgi:hypothetical protein
MTTADSPSFDFAGQFNDCTDAYIFGAATNQPMHKCEQVQIRFRVRDQGWGNQKGELVVRLKNASGETVASGCKWAHPFAHEWTDVDVVFDENDPIVQLSRSGYRYEVWYKVGGGGGHALNVEYFRLVATVASPSPVASISLEAPTTSTVKDLHHRPNA